MISFQIIEARPYHCGQMARAVRHEHRELVAQMGVDSHRELHERFVSSSFRRAWFIGNTLAALGGVTGCHLSAHGYVWLALTEIAIAHPIAAIKEARRQIAEIMTVKRSLVTSIIDGDDASRRFAIFLGFVPMDGRYAQAAVSRFGRREMLRRCEDDAARVRVGHTTVTMMCYQENA